ncbi:MAG: cell surface protein SprA, partial [Bacteroidota bacterium]
EGFYRSAGGGTEIQLNTFNLQEGSVTVKAGGRNLAEGTDYQIDYFGGKITILNPAILSTGQDIQVCFESSSLYQVQTKVLMGARASYNPSENLQLGATIMNLREQPFNQKTILGEEPTNNTLWGLDATFRKESDFVTKIIDKLPLVTSKETSTIDAAFEAAQFIPGQPRVVRTAEDRGIVYLDDFEAAATPFTLMGQLHWKLASFPEDDENDIDIFRPFNVYSSPLARNFSRAKLSWYTIDQAFYQSFGIDFPDEDKDNNYTRQVRPREIFPTATRAFGQNIQNTFDLRYIPDERGPYNFQTDQTRLDATTGKFTRPDENWAGIMREIDVNNDFEATNIEFVEFWVMDPFMDNPNHPGGDFYLNMGLINEDILDDESLSQEHGLPGPNAPNENLQTTAYGEIPIGNPPVYAFSNDRDDRVAQDIGYDGLTSAEEREFYEDSVLSKLRNFLSPNAFAAFEADPSTDDFLHFRDDTFETNSAGVLERYLRFNGVEGNSPVGEDQARFTVQATQQPDTEDLNGNGSLNFAEQYWEYKIEMRPDKMVPGQNFIVDQIDTVVNTPNVQNQRVRWYQVRLPLNAGRAVNGITNFKTISFMRMFMTGWPEEVILRMTEFQLVATQWRRFSGSLSDPGIVVPPSEPPFGSFELGSVSLEENSQKQPFNYALPPGIEQQAINGNTQAGFLQDERSLLLDVCDLQDGDARGIFKNVNEDLRLYERLKMFVHAEAIEDRANPSNFINRGDARMFLRLGLDNDQNYYEYEWPITPSDPGAGAGNVQNTWLEDNELDLELALLARAKEDRNNAGTGLIYRHAFADTTRDGAIIYVKGTPKLSDIRNIMIGVRNPQDPVADPICLEVWVNELRMTDFDNTKGWAANANISMNLGGIATINATGSYRSAGFGPLEQKLSNRSQEDILRYDLSGTFHLDRLFPKKFGLQLPIYATFGEQRINPLFNPQEADVRTDRLVESLGDEEAKEKLREIQDYTRNRSISFNNWRKLKNGGGTAAPRPGPRPGPRSGRNPRTPSPGQNGPKSYPWDISNFDFSFAYSETFARNAITARRLTTQHRGGINYRYNFPQVSWKPFEKSKFLKKIPLIGDFTLNPLPTSVSVAVTGDRQFEERLLRPTDLFGGFVDTTFTKNFLINRNYNLTWNLTRNLQFTFTANNVSRVDEVKGYRNQATRAERDSVGTFWENFLHIGRDPSRGHDNLINFGRTTTYTHNFNVGYQLPFQQIKMLSWISGTVNYTGSFNWQQAPEINPNLGATIGNNQTIQANGRLDLNNLYRKIKPLKEILDGQSAAEKQKKFQEKKRAKAQGPRTMLPGPDGPILSKGPTVVDKDTLNKDSFKFIKKAAAELARIVLSIRSIDITYNRNASMILPGYLPSTDNFGMDWTYTNPFNGQESQLLPPTLGFVTGSQKDIRQLAGENNWISRDTTLSSLFQRNNNEQVTARTSIELFKGFRIDLSANRSIMRNESEFFRWDPVENTYMSFDPLANGNFSMSYIFANTAFERNQDDSRIFNLFSVNRQIISQRLADENPNTGQLSQIGIVEGGFNNGYLGTNQEVLISSFLSSYGLIGPDRVSLSAFPSIPLPNWSINFNGLSNIPFLKDKFNSFTIRHTYRGSYSIGNYANNLNSAFVNGFPAAFTEVDTDPLGNPLENFYSRDNIQVAQITEQFSPLLGVNFTMKNGVTGQLDYKTGRQLSLSIGNLQLTERRNQDVAVMVGYRKDKLNWRFNFLGKEFDLQNSANFQFRATVRDTRERNRYLDATGLNPTRAPEYTRGTLNIIISPSIDYVVNNRLNIKLFFERNINNPYVNTAFNTSFTSAGVQVRFTLSQ